MNIKFEALETQRSDYTSLDTKPVLQVALINDFAINLTFCCLIQFCDSTWKEPVFRSPRLQTSLNFGPQQMDRT